MITTMNDRLGRTAARISACGAMAMGAAVLAVGLAAAPAAAAMLEANPSDDATWVFTVGGNGAVTSELAVESLYGSGLPGGHVSYRSGLEFDISSIPTGSVINAASLILTEMDPFHPTVATPVMEVRGYAADGTVAEVDLLGTAANSFIPGTLVAGGLSSPFAAIDATALVQALVTAGDDFAGFVLHITTDRDISGTDQTLAFASVEAAEAADRPLLRIDYTAPQGIPEPATLGLLVVGLAGLGLARRRRTGGAKSSRREDA